MPFGRKRAQETLEALTALDVRWRAALASYEESERSLFDAVNGLREEIVRRDAAVTENFERVVGVCTALLDHAEADRAERRALGTAVDGLAHTLSQLAAAASAAATPAAPVTRIVGGSFFGMSPAVIDATAKSVALERTAGPVDLGPGAIAVAPDDVVEVLCRFGNRWVDGFEVCEMIVDDQRTRYRLRRRSDGSILPTLFEANDIRHMRDPRPDDVPAGRKWSTV